MGYAGGKNQTNIDHVYARKKRLKRKTWRTFGQALQKHFLTHGGGILSSRRKGENRNYPGPEEWSILAAFEGIGKIHHEETDSCSWNN